VITPAVVLLIVFLATLFALALPLGRLLAHVFEGGGSRQQAAEARLCRLLGISGEEMGWWPYARALLTFNGAGILLLFILAKLQGILPWADGKAGVRTDTAWNAAISFVSNTNWQAWAGEATVTNFTQMAGFAVQNFLSAATGLAVAFALIRGFARDKSPTVGNFWLDILRGTAFVLLPLSLFYALFLVQQGVPQTFATRFDYVPLETRAPLEAAAPASLPIGPVASQEAIKMLGTNGGGFYNANSAHPFENPTPLANFVQLLSIFLLPAGLCAALGLLVGDIRQGRAIIAAMTLLFLATVGFLFWAELRPNPALPAEVHQEGPGLGSFDMSEAFAGGNLEGKELRFGAGASALYAAVTTAASCGAVNSMHDSLLPLGGLVPLFLMQLGEVVFGGVGAGLYGILVFAILAVFLAGLMIGRTPEYLGKKVEPFEMKMTALILLVTPFLVLGGAALAVSTEAGRAAIGNPGPHGFTQIVYALTSAANNNGSAFAGVSMDTPFWNYLLGAAMLLGRFAVIVPVLAIAGSVAAKKKLPATSGTLPTHGPLFVLLLAACVVVFGALTYLPTLALGPIAEHFQLFR
jgi:potassium-transporting ATPase potassium-binding subunit